MTDTFASRLRAYLHAEKDRLGAQALTAEQWDKAVNSYFSAYMATERMVKSKRKEPKTPLFMALCEACGINYAETVRDRVKDLERVVTKLRDVCPSLVPEEIKRRAAKYRQAHPTWTLTPDSLAKHWGELSNGAGMASSLDEPDGWRQRVDELFTQQERDDAPATIGGLPREPWNKIPRHMQQSIVRRWDKLNSAPARRDPVANAYFGD